MSTYTPYMIFIIVQTFLLVCQNTCYLKIEDFQYVEMLTGSLLLVLIFGFIGPTFISIPNLEDKSILLASVFSLWYYFTKYFTNSFMKDKNGVIHWTV
jgi:hypothetical protein